MKFLIILTLISAAFAELRDLSSTFPFSSTNKCGACLYGNNTFCILGTDNQTLSTADNIPAQVCCTKENPCPQNNTLSYSCSDQFNQSEYALAAVCPDYDNVCGDTPYFMFNRESDEAAVSFSGLFKG